MPPSSHENLEISLTPTATGYALTLRLMKLNLIHGPFSVIVDQNSNFIHTLFAGEAGQVFREMHAAVTGSGNDLHVRLLVPPDLHRLHWEEHLLSPVTQKPMACSGDQWLSRYLSGKGYRQLRPKGNLRALIAVAAPTPTTKFSLGHIDAAQQIAQVVAALDQIPHTVLGNSENSRTTWDRLTDALSDGDGYDILYLVAHGRIKGKPILYLVDENNAVVPCTGSKLAGLLERLGDRRPRLVVLASCESAGDGYSDALESLGPRLVRAGVPAVLAMQGRFSMASNQRFVWVFFRELLRDGLIARAVNMARQEIQNYPDWWMPVLYTHLRDGVLWEGEVGGEVEVIPAPIPTPIFPPPPPDTSPIRFVNREKEIKKVKELDKSRVNRPIYVSSPAGFGKSSLLYEIHRYFIAKKYDCLSVKVDCDVTMDQLICKFSEYLKMYVHIDSKYDPKEKRSGQFFIDYWNRMYKNRYVSRNAKDEIKGVVILIDFDGTPSKSLIDEITGEFINDCWDNLKTPLKAILILAGRALETLGLRNNPEPILLKPFTYETVKETVEQYLSQSHFQYNEIEQEQVAAHVFYLTGGHPGCIVELIKLFTKQGLMSDHYFAFKRSKSLWNSVISGFVRDFEQEIKKNLLDLYQVIEALCVFHYVNRDILQLHCNNYPLAGCSDADDLSDKLLQSYLFTDDRYISNGIGRQLITLKLRYEEPDRFRNLCISAAELCLQQIQKERDSHWWVLEYLFQRLQVLTITPLEQIEARCTACNTYLETEIPIIIEALQVAPSDLYGILNAMIGVLKDKDSVWYASWEFVFLFNYLFRTDSYNNEPIKALIKVLSTERDRCKPSIRH